MNFETIKNADKYVQEKYGNDAWLDSITERGTNLRRLYLLVVFKDNDVIHEYVNADIIDNWPQA